MNSTFKGVKRYIIIAIIPPLRIPDHKALVLLTQLNMWHSVPRSSQQIIAHTVMNKVGWTLIPNETLALETDCVVIIYSWSTLLERSFWSKTGEKYKGHLKSFILGILGLLVNLYGWRLMSRLIYRGYECVVFHPLCNWNNHWFFTCEQVM